MPIVNVAAANTPLLPSGRRKKIIATNLGTNRVWIIKKSDAALNEGFPLDSGEKVILDSGIKDNELNDNWNAIAETSATDISVYEVV